MTVSIKKKVQSVWLFDMKVVRESIGVKRNGVKEAATWRFVSSLHDAPHRVGALGQ